MIKDVILKITGRQLFADTAENDTVEITANARFGSRNGGYFLSYDESEQIGVPQVKTTLLIKPDGTVILERTGGLKSRLVVQEGVRNPCSYQTAFGELPIVVFGEKVENRLSDRGGSLTLQYTIESNREPISRNEVTIWVKEGSIHVNTG